MPGPSWREPKKPGAKPSWRDQAGEPPSPSLSPPSSPSWRSTPDRPGLPQMATSKPRKQVSLDQLMESLSPEIEEGLRLSSPRFYQDRMRKARSIVDRDQKRAAIKRIQQARKAAKTYNRSVNKFIAEYRRRGDHEAAKKLRAAQVRARRGETSPVEALKAGGTVVLEALDAAHKYGVRSWTTPERKGDKPGEIAGALEWTKRIREDASTLPMPWREGVSKKDSKAIPSFVTGLSDLIAAVPGGLLGAGVGVAGALTDVAAGRDVSMENIKETIADTHKDLADFVLIMGTDPLSWVSAGTAGTTKNAMTATARSMKPMVAAGRLTTQRAAKLVDVVGTIASKQAGTKRALHNVKRAFKAAGLEADDAAKIFGKKGEFFGKGQLTVHAPFASKYGVEVLPKLGLGEYAGAKAMQKAYKGALKPLEVVSKSKAKELFDPDKGFQKVLRREAKAEARAVEAQLLDDYEEISKLAPKSKDRREFIVRNFIDPDKPVMGPLQEGTPLTSREALWVQGLDEFFKKARDIGVKGKYLDAKQIGRNTYTGKYFPRQYDRNWGWFDELPEAKSGLSFGSPAMSRRADVPLGRTGLEIVGEADPHRAIPQYAQQLSRGVGAAKLENDMLKAFGVPRAKLEGVNRSKAFGGFTEIDKKFKFVSDKDMYLPNDAAKFLRGSFDNSVATFRKWASNMPGSTTPAGRAALKSMEVYAKVNNLWKRNVLVTRPAYHVVNFWNDALQSVVDGNTNYARWLHKSDRWLRGKGSALKVEGTGTLITGDEVIALAKKSGLPVEGGAAARIEQIGDRAAEYYRFQKASKGDPERILSSSTKRAVAKETLKIKTGKALKDYGNLPLLFPKTGEDLARAWETRSKLSHFAWRLSKGDSPAVAAERTLAVLLDYADPGRGVQIMRWVMPFATWTLTAPKMTARAIAKRPAAVSAVDRFFKTQSEEEGLAPRSYVSQRAPYYYMGPRGKQTLENLRFLGSRAVSPWTGQTEEQSRSATRLKGQDAVYMPREPFGESMTLPMEVSGLSSLIQEGKLQPRPEPFMGAVAPLIKGALETATAKDVTTGRELIRPELGGMFPARAPGVPAALRVSREGQTPWFSKYAAPMVIPPLSLLASNLALYEEGGGEAGRAPLATLGSYRPYAAPGQSSNIYAQQLLNMGLGIPSYSVSPADQPYEFAQRLKDLELDLYRARQEAKAAREVTRRGRR